MIMCTEKGHEEKDGEWKGKECALDETLKRGWM